MKLKEANDASARKWASQELRTGQRGNSLNGGNWPSSASIRAAAPGKKAEPTHVSVDAKGGRTLHNDIYGATKAVWGSSGWIETHPAGQVVWKGPYGNKPNHESKKRVAPGIQLGAGGEVSTKDKETNKNSNVGPSEWAKSTAAELAEAWWCNSAFEGRAERRDQERKHSGKVERSQLPDTPPKGLRFKGKPRPAPEVAKTSEVTDNWIGNANTLEAAIDEVTKPKPKPKPASKPAAKSASKPKAKSSSSAKPEKSDDQRHADVLMKMARTVTNSTAAGISPKHILAAGYAMHTFDKNVLATPKDKPKSKPKPKNESIEKIVDDFLEDTMTGNIGSIALGFAPTGEMDPHEGRPGPGKKKKKKNQFDRLSGMVSKNRYHKLTQKVAGAMPT